MSSPPDFQVEIECGGKTSVLSFRYSSTSGGPPVLLGVESDFVEFACRVFKPEIPKKITKKRLIEEIEYRKQKRQVFYDDAEDDSTEYTYDD